MQLTIRTIENIVSTNTIGVNADMVINKKVFQLVKYVTGHRKNNHFDYSIEQSGQWYGFDTVTVSGRLGFIRVTLEPLFREI